LVRKPLAARFAALLCSALAVLVLADCASVPPDDPQAALIRRGRELFFEETFAGNGRTCGTCHPAENNLTIDPAFIATLPADDPLFVAEFVPELRANFEKPELMRKFGLILENLDGFDDLERKFVMRGVPHTLGMRHSVASSGGPRTGWSGDGAPGDGSLRSFATGAVIQHFTKSLRRIAGTDFRLPTDDELDALAAFMQSLGRQEELQLPLALRGEVPRRGQQIFMDAALGKCNQCHANAGANANFGNRGNANFDTGVEDLPDLPAQLTGQPVPDDDGFGVPGDGTFNTPSLVEAADSGPFFHNNAVETIEGAVAFYNGESFKNSPAGQTLASNDPNGIAIRLDATQVVAVAAFLRVINALDNIRESRAALEGSMQSRPRSSPEALLRLAAAEIDDALGVLAGGGLHPAAVTGLRQAHGLAQRAVEGCDREAHTRRALDLLARARAELVEVH
jgi:cytochrome c peroxidase